MVVTTYFHKLVARLLLPCDKVVAWLLQPWHFYMGMARSVDRLPGMHTGKGNARSMVNPLPWPRVNFT